MTGTELELYVPPAVAFTPDGEDPDPVIDLHASVLAQNQTMWAQLEELGQPPTALLLHECALETLVDMLFEDEGKAKFRLGVDIRLNQQFKKQLLALSQKAAIPE